MYRYTLVTPPSRGSAELDPAGFLDALQCSDCHFRLGMRHRNRAGFHRVAKMAMASGLAHLPPTIRLDRSDHVFASHMYSIHTFEAVGKRDVHQVCKRPCHGIITLGIAGEVVDRYVLQLQIRPREGNGLDSNPARAPLSGFSAKSSVAIRFALCISRPAAFRRFQG